MIDINQHKRDKARNDGLLILGAIAVMIAGTCYNVARGVTNPAYPVPSYTAPAHAEACSTSCDIGAECDCIEEMGECPADCME